jgi:RimJ/RimL family protein N-acetyltransferase
VTVPREVLETRRLDLEPVNATHAESLFEAVVDSRTELLPWMPWAQEPTLQGSRSQAASSVRAWREDVEFHFCVVDCSTRDVLGVAGLNRDGPDSAELHYWIRSDRARQGLTTEACRALIEWAPVALGVSRITLWTGRDNAASRRVATKLGFAHLGPLDWQPDGGLGTFDAESYELRVQDPDWVSP